MTSMAAKVDAIYLPTDNTVASTASTIGEILQEAKVPAMGSDAAVIDATLFTYGVDYHAIVYRLQLAVKNLEKVMSQLTCQLKTKYSCCYCE